METTYETVKMDLEHLLNKEIVRQNVFEQQKQRVWKNVKEEIQTLHRKIEIYNAHNTIADKVDKPMKDVEFFLSCAMTLLDYGNQDDWKLQLKAALSILNKCSEEN